MKVIPHGSGKGHCVLFSFDNGFTASVGFGAEGHYGTEVYVRDSKGKGHHIPRCTDHGGIAAYLSDKEVADTLAKVASLKPQP